MQSTTNPQGMQMPTSSTTAGGENRRDAQGRHRIEAILWVCGLIVFILSCFLIHAHLSPYPFDVSTTQAVQGFAVPDWLKAVIAFPSWFDNPTNSYIALGTWLGFMLIMALISWLRRHSLTWLQSAIFFAVTVMASAGLNVLVDEIVGRPRPSAKDGIHVPKDIVPFPTYPSGHTEHDVAYYGFLLYLSFLKPVREWRYRWLLLPLQLYAVYDILTIGYSRIYEGDHWLTDVLGGYLEGAVYLFFFIFLYRWTTDFLARRRAQKQGQASQSSPAVSKQ